MDFVLGHHHFTYTLEKKHRIAFYQLVWPISLLRCTKQSPHDRTQFVSSRNSPRESAHCRQLSRTSSVCLEEGPRPRNTVVANDTVISLLKPPCVAPHWLSIMRGRFFTFFRTAYHHVYSVYASRRERATFPSRIFLQYAASITLPSYHSTSLSQSKSSIESSERASDIPPSKIQQFINLWKSYLAKIGVRRSTNNPWTITGSIRGTRVD